jgi:hypothetical protein
MISKEIPIFFSCERNGSITGASASKTRQWTQLAAMFEMMEQFTMLCTKMPLAHTQSLEHHYLTTFGSLPCPFNGSLSLHTPAFLALQVVGTPASYLGFRD